MPRSALRICGAWRHRRSAIEDEDWLDTKEEQLADSPKEANNMTVAQCISFLVADCFEKLVDPDTRINCESFPIQRLEFDRPSAWVDYLP